MPLPMSSDVAASTSPPAPTASERERRDQRRAPLGQPLGVLRAAAQLDRPVRELGDREERAGVQRRPLVDLAAAERPRVERPRARRAATGRATAAARASGEREQHDRGEREHADDRRGTSPPTA